MWTLGSFVWKINKKYQNRPLTYSIGSNCWKL
jgi:hypothetical protein